MSRAATLFAILLVLIFFVGVFGLRVGEVNLTASLPHSGFGQLISRVVQDDPLKRDRIVFLGDIMLARDVERKLLRADAAFPFLMLKERLAARVVVGNFEAAMPKVHQPTPNFGMVFSVTPALLDRLIAGGVTHLSLANNHGLDHGLAGYQNAVSELNLRGFEVFGHPGAVATNTIQYIEVGDKSIALVGIHAVYTVPSLAAIEAVLDEAERHSDVQIAYIHWGNEYELTNSAAQQRMAHSLVDAGFDLIVGHHPHVVQNIERYKDTLIFYSLGNFIFDQYFSQDVQEGLVLEVVPGQVGWSVVLVPVESKTVKVQPREMTDINRQAFLNALAARSSPELAGEISNGTLSLQF